MKIKNPNFLFGLIFILVVTAVSAQLVGKEPTIVPGKKYDYLDVLQIFLLMAVPFVFGLIANRARSDDGEDSPVMDNAGPFQAVSLADNELPPPYIACAQFDLEEVGAVLGEYVAEIRELPEAEYDASVMTVFAGGKLDRVRVELRERPSPAEHKR